MSAATLIDETRLEVFRRRDLAPEALLAEVERHVAVLYRLPVGVGKSFAVDELLSYAPLYAAFDLVVYAAPTWSILNERRIIAGRAAAPVAWMVLKPRPKDWCGAYAEDWDRLELQGCSTYAKATLCRPCRARGNTPTPCPWPEQLRALPGCRLLFLTEQQLVVNRSLVPRLRARIGPGRILVILDEARLLDANFELVVTDADLAAFQDVLASLPDVPERAAWLGSIEALQSSANPSALVLDLPPWLNRHAFRIQSAGLERLGPTFRYVGYDLALLAGSHPNERWKTDDGAIHFIARPYLHGHLLLLSAHATADYAGERLGRGPLHSPFERVRFRHSRSRIINLRSRIGADRYFERNRVQILDTIAVLIARNLRDGRTTLLISRKKSKGRCAADLHARLADWGFDVRLVWDGYAQLPATPDPRIIPVIHYGILGVNDFSEYEGAYCLNGYYVSSTELTRSAQEAVPAAKRRPLVIDSHPDRIRRVRVEGPDPGGALAHVGAIHLRKLELDPVVQAVGRVRPVTRHREVVVFQMADFARDLGPHEVVESLAALRTALGLPTAAELDRARDVERLESLTAQGLSLGDAATRLGLSRATAFRRLAAAAGLTEPLNIIRRVFETGPIEREAAP